MQNESGEFYVELRSTDYLYTDDPNIDMQAFKAEYSQTVNGRLNPNGTDVNSLAGMPTVKIRATPEVAKQFGVRPGQVVVLPAVHKFDVQVINGEPQEAVKRANGNQSKAVNFYYVYSGSSVVNDENGAHGGNSGYINANAINKGTWVHERIHDLGYSPTGTVEDWGEHSEDPQSIMAFPYKPDNAVRQDDFDNLNAGIALNEGVPFGGSAGNYIYDKNSNDNGGVEWLPTNSRDGSRNVAHRKNEIH